MTRRVLAVSALSVSAALTVAAMLPAQEATGALRASAVLSADTVLIGEPFTIGVVVSSDDPITVPQVLPSGEGWEQLDAARTETMGNEVRAYYRLVAWQTDPVRLPDLPVSAGSDGSREYSVRLPAPVIRSVIPASKEAPLLQPPRPPLDAGFPWGLLLAGLILAALFLWWLRYRTKPSAASDSSPADVPDAGALAREALIALRRDADAGSVAAAGFYDRLEQILRRYLAGSRAWSLSHPIRESQALAGAPMRDVHRQALLARFAAVGWPAGRLVSDADASLDWLVEDTQ